MRVPNYSPKDFAGAIWDALDWRRILIGVLLALWSALMLGPVIDLLEPFPRSLDDLSSGHMLAYLRGLDHGGIAWRVLLWGPFATYLILALAWGAVTEFCAGKRASFASLRAFADAKIGPALFSVAFVPLLYAPCAAIAALGLWLLPSAWGVAVLVIFGIPLLIAELLFTLWLVALPIQFSALAVSGGDGYESISRAVNYVWAAPFRYAMIFLGKIVALSIVMLPPLAIFIFTPDWLGWTLGIFVMGFSLSYGALTDVIIYVKLRHYADGTPYCVYHDPRTSFLELATGMEQEVAIAASGLLTRHSKE